MFKPDFDDDIWEWVKEWEPSKKYNHETQHRDDLYSYLRERLRGSKKSRLRRKSKIAKESGKERCGLVIDDKFGIELKRNLRKRNVDSLMGQLDRYVDNFERVGLVICRVKHPEAWDEVEDKIGDKYQSLIGLNKVELTKKEI